MIQLLRDENTSYIKRLCKNDKVIFYCGRGSKYFSHCFLGSAIIDKPTYKRQKIRDPIIIHGEKINDSIYKIDLKNIKVYDYAKPINPLIKNLSFIKKKDIWGTYLQGGIIDITKNEYDLIMNAEKKKIKMPILDEDPIIMGENFEKKIALRS